MIGVVAKKIGMSRLFIEEKAISVTVCQITPNIITQIKQIDSDGYLAIQVSYGKKKIKNITSPIKGHYARANIEPGCGLHEFRYRDCEKDKMKDLKVGDIFSVELFSLGQFIDACGISKGKGMAGVVKRWGFAMQPASHGNSKAHRAPGSIGQCQFPGRVIKNKKMPGRLGGVRCTIQNQQIVYIDIDDNLLLIKGAIPGSRGSEVLIYSSIKKRRA